MKNKQWKNMLKIIIFVIGFVVGGIALIRHFICHKEHNTLNTLLIIAWFAYVIIGGFLIINNHDDDTKNDGKKS